MAKHIMGELRKYRVKTGMHYELNEDGTLGKECGPGDIVRLREKEYPPFADKLEPYNHMMAPTAQQAELASIPDEPEPVLDEGAKDDSTKQYHERSDSE